MVKKTAKIRLRQIFGTGSGGTGRLERRRHFFGRG